MAGAFNIQLFREKTGKGETISQGYNVTWNTMDVHMVMRSFYDPGKKPGSLAIEVLNTTTAAETPQPSVEFQIAEYKPGSKRILIDIPIEKDEDNANDYKLQATFKSSGDIECDIFSVPETDSQPQYPLETNKTNKFKIWTSRVKNIVQPRPKSTVYLLWAQDPWGSGNWRLSERRPGKPYNGNGVFADRVFGRFDSVEQTMFMEGDRGWIFEYVACVMLATRLLHFHKGTE
ncbi:hypothetical protein J3458_001174 [Metarhizium acridum]|uniref:Uncharacterized protein n=1 Tax=Metarhizium acridum (strain CQMa 102) TaxID=655827 RepID=E9EBC5_METAQ|nr:uncharacterized protein MAC_07173 [Metarhizium acridum CQMa 102]EFY86769.1 hypothetical protein MAC_07173 [Metarhizium acridum CQMa 102]KAG8424377.1 hypothetical protein J3458_001174 [Metarhizium acridum]